MNGHDHDYERIRPTGPVGSCGWCGGIRQFVVGTGGTPLGRSGPRREQRARAAVAYGVLGFTLRAGSYDWEFIAIDGAIRDRGSAFCHRPSDERHRPLLVPLDRIRLLDAEVDSNRDADVRTGHRRDPGLVHGRAPSTPSASPAGDQCELEGHRRRNASFRPYPGCGDGPTLAVDRANERLTHAGSRRRRRRAPVLHELAAWDVFVLARVEERGRCRSSRSARPSRRA